MTLSRAILKVRTDSRTEKTLTLSRHPMLLLAAPLDKPNTMPMTTLKHILTKRQRHRKSKVFITLTPDSRTLSHSQSCCLGLRACPLRLFSTTFSSEHFTLSGFLTWFTQTASLLALEEAQKAKGQRRVSLKDQVFGQKKEQQMNLKDLPIDWLSQTQDGFMLSSFFGLVLVNWDTLADNYILPLDFSDSRNGLKFDAKVSKRKLKRDSTTTDGQQWKSTSKNSSYIWARTLTRARQPKTWTNSWTTISSFLRRRPLNRTCRHWGETACRSRTNQDECCRRFPSVKK